VPVFCSVTVVVKNRSSTPNDVDLEIFSTPYRPTHTADSRPSTDVSDTDVNGTV
jgi:hypothetical protein